MRPPGRNDLLALFATGEALAVLVVVAHGERWLAAAAALARSPLVPVLTGSSLGGLVALLLTRHLLHAAERQLTRRPVQ